MKNQIMFSKMYTRGCLDYNMIPYKYPTLSSSVLYLNLTYETQFVNMSI